MMKLRRKNTKIPKNKDLVNNNEDLTQLNKNSSFPEEKSDFSANTDATRHVTGGQSKENKSSHISNASEKKTAESNEQKHMKKNKCAAVLAFIKNYKKQIKLTIMIAAFIAILLFIYFTSLNLRFSIKEDLRIEIPERHLDFTINHENPVNIEIPVSIKTSRLCKASCTQRFTNINSGETEFAEQLTFRRSSTIEFERVITPYILGEGQDIYLYSINCTNIETANCPSGNSNIEKDIIITITRTLTESESKLKLNQENILNESYHILNKGLEQIDYSSEVISQLQYAKKNDLEINLAEIKKHEAEFYNSLSAATDAWLTYNHSHTQQIIESENLQATTLEFRNNSAAFYAEASSRPYTHNLAVDLTYFYMKEISASADTLTKSTYFIEPYHDELNSDLKEAQSLLNYSARKLTNKDFEKYEDLFLVLNGANQSINSFKTNYETYMQNNSAFLKAHLDFLLSEEDICILLNETNNKINNTTTNKTICNLNFADSLIYYSFEPKYANISKGVTAFCNDFENMSNSKSAAFIESNLNRINLSGNNSEILPAIDNESAKYHLQRLHQHKLELSVRNDSAAIDATKIIDSYIDIIELQTGLKSENLSDYSINYSLLIYFTPLNFTFSDFDGCDFTETPVMKINISYENVSALDSISKIISAKAYNNQLPELLPRACFDGECKPYIRDESKNYPIIIVHGHGFYSKNAAVTPSEVHNELQNQLLAEKLYVPAGILKYDTPILENSLSHIDVPFIYKATYYPKDILDNESIDLFADRLNQIITNAKQETGKDKVILIAHSMGGLVTRSYLKKYGTEDIDLVIIGGTPNYGINSETVKLCKLFGRNLECDEMYEKGQFVEDLKKEPKYRIPIYTLRGEGCPTFGDDGDGIVQSKHVPLNYAHNFAFNGTCSATGAFHVNLLNPNVNPQIYEKLKEILIENKN